MNQRILITGSAGLVGKALTTRLAAQGADVVHFDLHAHGQSRGDVRDRDRLREVVANVSGIIHLAAVSRVIWGERDPAVCWATNVTGVRNVLEVVSDSPRMPWLIFASSREVYGQPIHLPVDEDCSLSPVNVYGRSKVEGELLVEKARRSGVRACTIRLSNVFGSTADHADRVVPAFARAAVLGRELRVDGLDQTFDFTHIDDVSRGIVALVELLAADEPTPPPIHFVSGRPTTLGELASLSIRIARSSSTIRVAAPRDFDVARFFGNPERARALLGWQPQVRLEEGVARLVHAFHESPHAIEVEDIVQ
ncbi:NAD-dependent dehydratase [Ectothiorhodospira shaposhnikovii]|uniref:NAD-dependent epimerase/dehydratase family protein n=1 Tax=Ectothiorhodospira shaposhnikovii TaxID=1054 RepID=UPI001904CA25|nr:NAD(P)-dependent oxidoreductase [Ectothiorhodospira shaposhnikovii]MBK1672990.1 NAD-dependent dehydratase [Ectothiorhodospira shaposhnikovii]